MQKQALGQKVVALVRTIRNIMSKLGTRKLYDLLKNELKALGVGRDKLFRILRANNLLIKPTRSYHITTDSHHRFKKHKNITGSLEVVRPEQVWVSDITYVGTRANPSYLALITDAYSKKIMGYNVSNTLAVKGSLQALEMALKNRSYNKALIHHSDRGLQYCSNDYQRILDQNNIKTSMTEKYDPYENAIAERINGILKQEFVELVSIDRVELMQKLVDEGGDIYNTIRPHLSCDMLTPKQMHQQSKKKYKSYKKQNLIKTSFNQV